MGKVAIFAVVAGLFSGLGQLLPFGHPGLAVADGIHVFIGALTCGLWCVARKGRL